MNIAVLSGKGGAGKTFVATNLAALAERAIYADADVEAPNGHIFFKPDWYETQEVTIDIPSWNAEQCTHCGVCTSFCKYGALIKVKDRIHVFEELCHACGGCSTLCQANAFDKMPRSVGEIQKGTSNNVMVLSGKQHISVASGVPIIERLNELIMAEAQKNSEVFIDCPPGSACTVMASIKKADFCILVAEPTRYGVHNLDMVVSLVKLFKKPFGIVINRALKSENIISAYCKAHHIEVLATIAFDESIGKIVSEGKILVREMPSTQEDFKNILLKVKAVFEKGGTDAPVVDS